MGLPTQKSTAITRDREIEIYKKSVRKEQTRFSGCDHFDRNDVSIASNSRNVGNSCNAKNASATSNTSCKCYK